MKKVRLKNNEYMAALPPYRFAAGDVIEIDDAWADQMVQRGIARTASKNAQTVQEIRAEERGTQEEVASADRSARRAALMAQLADLDREDAVQPFGGQADEDGNYSAVMTRGYAPGEPMPEPEKPGRRGRRATADADESADGDEKE